MLLIIPEGLNITEYVTIIVVEFLFLLCLLYLSVLASVNYRKKKTILRLYVVFFMLVNLGMFIWMVTSKILILTDLMTPSDTIYLIEMIFFLFTNVIAWMFYTEVFYEKGRKVLLYRVFYLGISLGSLGIYIIMPNALGETIFYSAFFVLAGFTFIGLMVSSLRLKKKLQEKLDKLGMTLLFFTGLSILLTLALSLVNQVLVYMLIISSWMSGLYLPTIGIGLIPVFFVYVAFFQPMWLKRRYEMSNAEQKT